MEYPEDLAPVVVPAGVIELRVHGVSGTPPEDLIREPPILVAGSNRSGFYRSDDHTVAIEAYSWGGLTSGSWSTAFWLLLLPFSLFNVAGWMVPEESDAPADESDVQRHFGVSRMFALVGTLFVAVTSFNVATHLVRSSLDAEDGVLGWLGEVWAQLTATTHTRLFVATTVAALVPAMLWSLCRISSRRYEEIGVGTDAVASVGLEVAAVPDPSLATLWDQPGFVRALSELHLGASLGAIAMLASFIVLIRGDGGGPSEVGSWVAFVLGAASIAASTYGVTRTTREDSERKVWRARLWTFVTGPIAVLVAGLAALFSGFKADIFDKHGTTALVDQISENAFGVVIFLAFVLAARLIRLQSGMGASSSKGFSLAFFSWGFVVIAIAPSGLLRLMGFPLESVALYSCLTLLVVLFTGIAFVSVWKPMRNDPPVDKAKRLRSAVDRAPTWLRRGGLWLLAAFLVGFLAYYPARILTGQGSLPNPIRWRGGAAWLGPVAWLVPVWLLLAAVLAGRSRGFKAVALAVVAIVVGVTLAVLSQVGDNRIQVSGSFAASATKAFVIAATYAVVVAPILGVVWFIFRASQNRKLRRSVGVWWDLVNYWPRWNHPWAPPPYTEQSIPDLEARLRVVAAESHVVLSAHSQGALIALPVVLRSTATTLAGTSLLTYGCLLDRHYHLLFPRFFNQALFESVDSALSAPTVRDPRTGEALPRWINLHRITDPLGHPVREGSDRSVEVACVGPSPYVGGPTGAVLTHGDYQYSQEYQTKLEDLC